MKIHAFCGKATYPNDGFQFAPFLMQAKALSSIGTEIGQFIGYEGVLSEITDKRDDEVQLIAAGWVKIVSCSTDI